MLDLIHVLITVCAGFQCEPIIITTTIREYGGGYYDRSYPAPFTKENCRNSIAEYRIRDFNAVNPKTKDIYYLDPVLVGFRGAIYDPDTVTCWPLTKGIPQ